ncbi:hypothetical protein BJ123_1308 [Rhodopseudomonas thermotolerans]|uniref:Uncharacterized protein n=3 Tax=Nitrobacteraceae TaxID=41294 RepID=A0A336JWN8_9BRAD|nr:hypothetical protein BJ125_1308 [Rhodopseudomonas pentothenatexigens]REF90404.1 hypothetical protein BJ123_1308 [Rhodopseudomonas thermotolerans]SSW93103.1 hypothetical protein SAMN05892882_1308 [Rhodopseudomonas pentothenatexigens]
MRNANILTDSRAQRRNGHPFKSEDHKLAMDKIARFFSGEGPIRPKSPDEPLSDTEKLAP